MFNFSEPKSPLAVAQDNILDEFLNLFSSTWSVLREIIAAHGQEFSPSEIDRIKLLDIQFATAKFDLNEAKNE